MAQRECDKITGIQDEEVLLFVRFANFAIRNENIGMDTTAQHESDGVAKLLMKVLLKLF